MTMIDQTLPGGPAIGDDSLVQIRRVRKSFGAHMVLRDVSLEVPAGTVTVLLGPSGSGKTTCLRLIGGFELPTEGQIFLHGEVIKTVPEDQIVATLIEEAHKLAASMDAEASGKPEVSVAR